MKKIKLPQYRIKFFGRWLFLHGQAMGLIGAFATAISLFNTSMLMSLKYEIEIPFWLFILAAIIGYLLAILIWWVFFAHGLYASGNEESCKPERNPIYQKQIEHDKRFERIEKKLGITEGEGENAGDE